MRWTRSQANTNGARTRGYHDHVEHGLWHANAGRLAHLSPRQMRHVLAWTRPRCFDSARTDRTESPCQRDGCRRARRERRVGWSSLPAKAEADEELISRRIWRSTRMAGGDRWCSIRLSSRSPFLLQRQPLRPMSMGSNLDPRRSGNTGVRHAPWSVGIGFAATGGGA